MLTLRALLPTLGLLGAVGPALALPPDGLPVPSALEPAVGFWQRIYTEVTVDEGIIHDTALPMRIVARVDVPRPPQWQARREAITRALDRHRRALRALAEASMQPANARQAALRARLPGAMDAAAARVLADRLRFQGGLRERFRDGLVRSGRWQAHIRAALAEHGVPAALAALPHVESSFNPRARSHAGAAGLWQFTAGTGRRFLRIDPLVDERLDPWRSSRAAAALLAHNHAEIGSWPLAITAYNHGLNGMRRAVEALGSQDYMAIRRDYEGARFGFSSKNFYPALIAAARVDRQAGQHFPGLRRDSAVAVVRVELPHYTPLNTLRDGLDIDRATLLRLNPALGPSIRDARKFIPRGYGLVLPRSDQRDWARAVAQLPGDRLYRDQRPSRTHRVDRGQTLSGIAARYGVGVSDLMATNGITDPRRLRAGQRLDLPIAGADPRVVGGRRYEVRPGDTLGGIAVRHDVGTDQLMRMNELEHPDRIRAGQQLIISQAASVAVVDMADEP